MYDAHSLHRQNRKGKTFTTTCTRCGKTFRYISIGGGTQKTCYDCKLDLYEVCKQWVRPHGEKDYEDTDQHRILSRINYRCVCGLSNNDVIEGGVLGLICKLKARYQVPVTITMMVSVNAAGEDDAYDQVSDCDFDINVKGVAIDYQDVQIDEPVLYEE